MKTTINKIVFAFLLFTFTTTVNAAVGSLSISGATINVGETTTVYATVSGGLGAASGVISSNDSSCVAIGNFVQVDLTGNNPLTTVAEITIKGLRPCSTTLSATNVLLTLADASDETGNLSFTSGTITVNSAQQETNDQPTTTQPAPNETPNNNVPDNTSIVTNTQSNTPAVTPATTTGSSNNFLSMLSVLGYDLDKKFNSNTLNYNISVGADVNDITVNAKTIDSNAKVTIYGTDSLKSGENTVTAVVTAENGSKRTYTIAVNKEKNPDEEKSVKSKNNYLKELKLTNGVLSPVFSKEKTKYVVYLPFEETKLNLEGLVEDEKATLKINAPEKLKIGDNKITVEVTAEDGTKKAYTIIAKRGINPEFMDNKNTYLKSVDLTSGKLVGEFKKDVYEYYYKGKLDITGYAEDENATVRVFKDGDITYIEVEAPNGDFSIYTFRPYEATNSIIFKVLIFLVGFIAGFIFKILLSKMYKKKKQKKLKKAAKKESNS